MSECPIHDDPMYGLREPSQSRIEPITKGMRLKSLVLLLGKYRWRIDKDWPVKLPDGKVIVIPEGFVHDGASFPRSLIAILSIAILLIFDNPLVIGFMLLLLSLLAVSVFHPMGRAMIPGIAHDYLYRYHRLILDDGADYMAGCSLFDADNLFQQIYLNRHETVLMAMLTTWGMKFGSWAAWNSHRKNIDLRKKPPIV